MIAAASDYSRAKWLWVEHAAEITERGSAGQARSSTARQPAFLNCVPQSVAMPALASFYLEDKVAQLSMHFTTCTSISAFL